MIKKAEISDQKAEIVTKKLKLVTKNQLRLVTQKFAEISLQKSATKALQINQYIFLVSTETDLLHKLLIFLLILVLIP